MSNLKIPDLSHHKVLPEWGRAAYFYTHYSCIYQSSDPQHTVWKVPIGIMSNAKDHFMKGFFIVKSDTEFEPYLERFSSPSCFDRLHSYITTTREETVSKLTDVDFKKMSREELAELISWYYRRYSLQMIPALNMRVLDRALIPKLRSLFSHEPEPDSLVALSAVSDDLSFGLEEEVALLQTAINVSLGKFSRVSTECELEVRHIYREYTWSVLGYHNEQPKSLETYHVILDEMISGKPIERLRELMGRINKEREERKALEEKYKGEGCDLIRMASRASYMKDYFKSSMNKVQYYAEPLFLEIALRTGKSVGFIKDLTFEETPALLLGERIDEGVVIQRTRHNTVCVLDGSLFTLVGSDADSFEKEYLHANLSGAEQRGRVACRGKVIGCAKVVLNGDDFSKLKQGDVLVVANTSPDFVPIMRKASAIVAEEGGLTAHVSVVSREFGIPCVVGIPHITDILKDGDMVEVDAEKGVVRIVKRVS